MSFNFKQITLAREYRNYSQTELAAAIQGLSQSNLSKFEKGVSSLSEELVEKIVNFLGFPESFFHEKISIVFENAEYRKRSTINKRSKIEIEYNSVLIGYLIDQMSNSLDWPEFKFNPLDLEDGYLPESVAKHTRKLVGLKDDDPVSDIFTILEKNGIIVVELSFSEKFDGVSFLTDKGTPIIIVNKNKSNDRKRFTLAHELGHLLMHVTGNFPIPEYRDREDEANKFASEFLVPESAIRPSLIGLRLSYLSELKIYWLTSMALLVRRAKDLNCINQDRYTYLNIELSRRGYKKKEPIDVPIDEPKLFSTGYKMHKDDLEYSDKELSNAFHLPDDILDKFFKIPINPSGKMRVLY